MGPWLDKNSDVCPNCAKKSKNYEEAVNEADFTQTVSKKSFTVIHAISVFQFEIYLIAKYYHS